MLVSERIEALIGMIYIFKKSNLVIVLIEKKNMCID